MKKLVVPLCLSIVCLALPSLHGQKVWLGNEVLRAEGFPGLSGKRVGLLTNPSGIDSRGLSTVQVFRQAENVQLVALFAVEHGINGKLKAGDKVGGLTDPQTGIPVFSIYGRDDNGKPLRKPTPEMLRQIDILVYDLQDAGLRSFTYISAMGLAMEACGEQGVEFMVLDRPNPLGGITVEGPMLEKEFRSYVGQWEIPYRYAMTCGELAWMIREENWLSVKCKLTIAKMHGWRRSMSWKDTELAWVAPSPMLPDSERPAYLASTGIIGEICGLSGLTLGGGSPFAFQCVAATWLDPEDLMAQLKQYNLPGIEFTPIEYQRTTPLGLKNVRGTRILIRDVVRAPLTALNFYLFEAVRVVAGRDLIQIASKTRPDRIRFFEKIVGSDTVRKSLSGQVPVSDLLKHWEKDLKQFEKVRQKYLIPEYSDR